MVYNNDIGRKSKILSLLMAFLNNCRYFWQLKILELLGLLRGKICTSINQKKERLS
jgi:hypothetical protein